MVEHNGSFHMIAGDFIGGINANGQPSGRDFRVDYATSASVEGPYSLHSVITNNAQVIAHTCANNLSHHTLIFVSLYRAHR